MPAPVFNINLKGIELLVVEDDATSALFISRALSKAGASVDTANNGTEGFRKFLERRYQIVITDNRRRRGISH